MNILILLQYLDQFGSTEITTVCVTSPLIVNSSSNNNLFSVISANFHMNGLHRRLTATIPKDIVGGFELTAVLQRNLKEWHERPWKYFCEC